MEGFERKITSSFAPKIFFFCPVIESILGGVSQKAKKLIIALEGKAILVQILPELVGNVVFAFFPIKPSQLWTSKKRTYIQTRLILMPLFLSDLSPFIVFPCHQLTHCQVPSKLDVTLAYEESSLKMPSEKLLMLLLLLLKLLLRILKLKFGQNIEAEVLKSFLSSIFVQNLSSF